jgi:hypothetical protein
MHEVTALLAEIDEPINLIWASAALGFGVLLLAAFAIHRGVGIRATFCRWLGLEIWPPKPPPNKS